MTRKEYVQELRRRTSVNGRRVYLNKEFGPETDDRAELHKRALLFTLFRERKLWPEEVMK